MKKIKFENSEMIRFIFEYKLKSYCTIVIDARSEAEAKNQFKRIVKNIKNFV